LNVCRAAQSSPDSERSGLTVQIRRGGVSVASNIAEGCGRCTTAEYIGFLKIARGTLDELDTRLLFAVELKYLDVSNDDRLKECLEETERVLAGLIRSLDR